MFFPFRTQIQNAALSSIQNEDTAEGEGGKAPMRTNWVAGRMRWGRDCVYVCVCVCRDFKRLIKERNGSSGGEKASRWDLFDCFIIRQPCPPVLPPLRTSLFPFRSLSLSPRSSLFSSLFNLRCDGIPADSLQGWRHHFPHSANLFIINLFILDNGPIRPCWILFILILFQYHRCKCKAGDGLGAFLPACEIFYWGGKIKIVMW